MDLPPTPTMQPRTRPHYCDTIFAIFAGIVMPIKAVENGRHNYEQLLNLHFGTVVMTPHR